MDLLNLSLVLASALLHAVWSVAIKGSRDPLSFNLLQTGVLLIAAVPVVAWIDLREIDPRVWQLILATGLCHGLYFYWMSRAYELSDISLVYPIARSTPAFLPLLAVPLLGEQISLLGALGIATVVAGLWIVAAGEGLSARDLLSGGALFAWLTLAATIGYGLFDKSAMARLDRDAWSSPIPRAIAYFFLLSIACSAVFTPLALRRVAWPALREATRRQAPKAALALAASLGSYGLILEALRSAQASYVVSVRQASVFFVLALSVLWLGERPGRLRVIGASATVLGTAMIGLGG